VYIIVILTDAEPWLSTVGVGDRMGSSKCLLPEWIQHSHSDSIFPQLRIDMGDIHYQTDPRRDVSTGAVNAVFTILTA